MAGIFEAKLRVAAKTVAPGTTGESSYTENVCILPANAYILSIFGRVKTAFAGLTSPEVALGVSGDTDLYMSPQSLDVVNELVSVMATGAGKAVTGVRGYCAGLNKPRIHSTATPIIATFSSSSDTFDPSAGEVEFVVVYVDPNEYVSEKLFS
jgi:hypothetical protein